MIRASAPREEIREEVAEAANVLSRLGLVTAYGHVSARVSASVPGPGSAPAGGSMLITPAADLASVTAVDVLEVPLRTPGPLPAGVPAEAWVHLALYQARPDAAAIARAQPPSAYAAAATATSLVPLHGQAAWLGESVPVHDSAALLRSRLAERAARSLPAGEALLLRGNGAVTLGATAGPCGGPDVAAGGGLRRLPRGPPGRCHPAVRRGDRLLARSRPRTATPAVAAPAPPPGYPGRVPRAPSGIKERVRLGHVIRYIGRGSAAATVPRASQAPSMVHSADLTAG